MILGDGEGTSAFPSDEESDVSDSDPNEGDDSKSNLNAKAPLKQTAVTAIPKPPATISIDRKALKGTAVMESDDDEPAPISIRLDHVPEHHGPQPPMRTLMDSHGDGDQWTHDSLHLDG